MLRVKLLGFLMIAFAISLISLISYTFVAPPYLSEIIVKLTLWIFVTMISLVIGWIGFVLITAKQSKSADEMRREIEEEIEKIKKEAIDAVMYVHTKEEK